MSYIGYGVLLVIATSIIICANSLSKKHRATQQVKCLSISVVGGGATPLADSTSIREWLASYKLLPEGLAMKSVNIATMERIAKQHSAVANANAHMSYDGEVFLDVELREPVARLRIDGYDMYITKDGFVLPTVSDRTAPVVVITGDYKPLFGASYTGYAHQAAKDSLASLERDIERLERAKTPYYKKLSRNDAVLRDALSERVRKGLFMSDREFKILNEELEERKVEARESHKAKQREFESAIAALEAQQYEARMKQRAVRDADAHFSAMLDFLVTIAANDFWHAEVVQVTMTGGGSEPLQLGFVPRSGDFIVDLGTTEELDTKLNNLYRFYVKGLDRIGWDKYKSISLRYKGQVVCR